jgi:hypothetical protein
MASRKGPKRAAPKKGTPKEIIIARLPEAERIANGLIEAHHTHLISAKIVYLSTTAKRKKCDRVRLGSAQKASGLLKWSLAEAGTPADFIILISQGDWQWLPETHRVALVDHELAHCWRFVTDKGRESWGLRGHDVEEFTEIIARHGLWRREHEELASVVRQLPLEGATKGYTPQAERENGEGSFDISKRVIHGLAAEVERRGGTFDRETNTMTLPTEESEQEPVADADRVADGEAAQAEADDQVETVALDPDQRQALEEIAAARETAEVAG